MRIIDSRTKKKNIKNKVVVQTGGSQHHVVPTHLTYATINSTESGALTAMVSSGIAIIMAWWRGEMKVNDAFSFLLHDAIEGGAKGATTNVISTGTRHALVRSGAANLARGHAPTAIATTFIMASILIYQDIKKYHNGELSKGKLVANAVRHLTISAAKTCVTIVFGGVGAVLGSKYGPIGTIVGATIGATVGYIGIGKLIEFISVLA